MLCLDSLKSLTVISLLNFVPTTVIFPTWLISVVYFCKLFHSDLAFAIFHLFPERPETQEQAAITNYPFSNSMCELPSSWSLPQFPCIAARIDGRWVSQHPSGCSQVVLRLVSAGAGTCERMHSFHSPWYTELPLSSASFFSPWGHWRMRWNWGDLHGEKSATLSKLSM